MQFKQQGLVVRKVDSTINRIVIFSNFPKLFIYWYISLIYRGYHTVARRYGFITFRKCGNAFPRVIYKNIQNSQTSHDCIFLILRYFATKLHNFTKFMMLFPAVLMNFPNSEVCLIGEWSIAFGATKVRYKCQTRPKFYSVHICFLSRIYPLLYRKAPRYIYCM